MLKRSVLVSRRQARVVQRQTKKVHNMLTLPAPLFKVPLPFQPPLPLPLSTSRPLRRITAESSIGPLLVRTCAPLLVLVPFAAMLCALCAAAVHLRSCRPGLQSMTVAFQGCLCPGRAPAATTKRGFHRQRKCLSRGRWELAARMPLHCACRCIRMYLGHGRRADLKAVRCRWGAILSKQASDFVGGCCLMRGAFCYRPSVFVVTVFGAPENVVGHGFGFCRRARRFCRRRPRWFPEPGLGVQMMFY